jgi:hypothetical protein
MWFEVLEERVTLDSDLSPQLQAVIRNSAAGYLQGRLRVARISRSAEYTDSFPRPERFDKTPGTIGLYDFTIDTGRYAMDRSGHGNHGIIIGVKFAKAESN